MLDKTHVPCLKKTASVQSSVENTETCSKVGIACRCSNRCSATFTRHQNASFPTRRNGTRSLLPWGHPNSPGCCSAEDAGVASKTTDLENIWWSVSQYFISLAAGMWKNINKSMCQASVRSGKRRRHENKVFFCIIIHSFQSNRPTEVVALWYTCCSFTLKLN